MTGALASTSPAGLPESGARLPGVRRPVGWPAR